MIVVDASLVIELLLDLGRADAIRTELGTRRPSLCAPHLLDIEVAQVVRRFVRSGQLDVPRAELALDDLSLLPITRYAHTGLLREVFALRENLTAYDAVYVSLTHALGAELWTCDAALARTPTPIAPLRLFP